MPSIAQRSDRHAVVDDREDQYLCFPDVAPAPSGGLVCVYNQFDQHTATRRAILMSTSPDGRAWSAPRELAAEWGHCPRLGPLPGTGDQDGELLLLDHNGRMGMRSADGLAWTGQDAPPVPPGHVLLDRPLPLCPDELLTTGHAHRGSAPRPNLGQPPSEQMVFRSANRGLTYTPLSVLSASRHLVLCEASMCLVPGRGEPLVAALMRENSFVFEPMYLCLSEDGGRTWTEPEPTPLVGHRPTLAPTRSGRLLVTYRDVGPDPGTAAFMGTLDELRGDYLVHGLVEDPALAECSEAGLRLDATGRCLWALRPMTDPTSARAELGFTVRVDSCDRERGPAAFVHLGCRWVLRPGRIEAFVAGEDGPRRVLWRKLAPDRDHELRLSWEPGRVTLRMNGRRKAVVEVDADARTARHILWGTPGEGGGRSVWKRMALSISEPRFLREYRHEWTPAMGLPHAEKLARVLELANSRGCHYGDFGYSGWCEPEPGSFVCTYHHAESGDPAYEPSHRSHVRASRFLESDWT